MCGFNFNQQEVETLNRTKAGPQLTATAVTTTGVDPTTTVAETGTARHVAPSYLSGRWWRISWRHVHMFLVAWHRPPAGPRVQLMLPVGVNSWALKYYKIDQTADTKIRKLRHARKTFYLCSLLSILFAPIHTHTHRYLVRFYGSSFLGSVIKSIKVKVELFYSFHIFPPCRAT